MYTYPTTPIPSLTYPVTHAFNTLINQYGSGKESRSALMRFPKRNFTITYELLSLADRNLLHDFYRQVYGATDSFWFYDFISRKWIDEYLGRGVVYNPTFALAVDGGVYTDETTAALNSTANDMTLLPSTPAVDDQYIFGWETQIPDVIRINIGTAGVGTWTIVWEYFRDNTWVALSNVVDWSYGFTVSGQVEIEFDKPTDATKASFLYLTPSYMVRARVSSYTSKTTQPKGTQAWVGSKYYDLHGKTTSSQSVYINGELKSSSGSATNNALLHLNGTDASVTITDEYAGHTWTCYGNAQLDTADKKFGTASLLLDGAGDYVASTNFTNLGERFTLEGWFHTDVTTTLQQGIIAATNANGMGVFLGYNMASEKKMYLFVSSNGYSWDVSQSSGTKIDWVAGTWYKWVIDFDGYTYRVFFGTSGTLTLDISITSSLKPCPITIIKLGSLINSWYLDGGIDEFRMTLRRRRYGGKATAEAAEFSVDNYGGDEYSILTGGGESDADRIQFSNNPVEGTLLTSDFTGYLRIKGRMLTDSFQEEMISQNKYFNARIDVAEVQW